VLPRNRIDGAAALETGEITIALAAMSAYPTGITTALDISHVRAPAGESVARRLGESDGCLERDVS
jgi:hypothetical protein